MADPDLGTPKARGADSKGSRNGLYQGNGLSLREQVRAVSMRLESEIILRVLERNRWNWFAPCLPGELSFLFDEMKKCDPHNDGGTARDGRH